MKQYKEMLEFRTQQYNKVLNLAKQFNIILIEQEDFPMNKLAILKCEDNNLKGSSVYGEFKKRKFFKNDNV